MICVKPLLNPDAVGAVKCLAHHGRCGFIHITQVADQAGIFLGIQHENDLARFGGAQRAGETDVHRRVAARFQSSAEVLEGRRVFIGGVSQLRVQVAINLEGGKPDRVRQSLTHSLAHKRLDADMRDHPEQDRGQNGDAGKGGSQAEA